MKNDYLVMKEPKINKTNAARLLDKAKIAYELIPYEVDEKDLSAIHVAASLGEDIEQVFKTLILHGAKTDDTKLLQFKKSANLGAYFLYQIFRSQFKL